VRPARKPRLARTRADEDKRSGRAGGRIDRVQARRAGRGRLLVVAALIERQGRVLLSQRREDQSFPLLWEFPGGKVEAGETPVEALVREIHEELNCTIRVGDIEDLVFFAYPDFDLVMPVYRARIVRGRPRPAQVRALAWIDMAALARTAMPPADLPLASRLARAARTRARR
jgi:8-oxo-dGTP diphosphatase